MERCQHCGQAHDPGTLKCTTTGYLMSAPGLIGQRVDRYQVERLLGIGGFGTVYRARHVHTDATVALKLLKRELNADQSMIERFMREAKAASAVGSEHIVGVLDAGIAADGQAFLVLEFLDGWDLKDLIYREGPQSPERLVQIVLQALEGLAAAHARGVVHGDLKLSDLKLFDRDTVRVMGFLTARLRSGPPPSDPAQDVLALGRCFAAMLSGRTYGKGQSAPLSPARDLEKSLPPAVYQVLIRLTAEDPARRYPTMADAADALAKLVPTPVGQPRAFWRRLFALGS